MESVAELLTHILKFVMSLSNICSWKAWQCGKCLIKHIRSDLHHCQGLVQGKSLMLYHERILNIVKWQYTTTTKNFFKVECSIVVLYYIHFATKCNCKNNNAYQTMSTHPCLENR